MSRRQALADFTSRHDPRGRLDIGAVRIMLSNITDMETTPYIVPGYVTKEDMDAAANSCDGTHEDFVWRVLNRRGDNDEQT